jgi:purine nucleosidase
LTKRKFVIDTDTASDDAVALIMALKHPGVEVEAITIVAGNVEIDKCVRNALFTVELCGSKVPVYRGADRPLRREPVHAHLVHGEDGLGNMNYPPPKSIEAEGYGPNVIVDTIRANPGLVLVTLGPLTNVALALEKDPTIASQVSRCVIMGGVACTVGNITPAAEFNVWVDPEAAKTVFHSGLPIEMVGWELSRGEANLKLEEIDEVRGYRNELADFAIDCNQTLLEFNKGLSGDAGIDLPDPVAMAIALEPEICSRSKKHYVEIETESDLTRGMTVVDELGVADWDHNKAAWGTLLERDPNATVCWELDIPAFKKLLKMSLR